MQLVCTTTSGPGGATRHEQGARPLDLTTLSWTIVSQVMMND